MSYKTEGKAMPMTPSIHGLPGSAPLKSNWARHASPKATETSPAYKSKPQHRTLSK